jgi:Pectate lyase superfamily protein
MKKNIYFFIIFSVCISATIVNTPDGLPGAKERLSEIIQDTGRKTLADTITHLFRAQISAPDPDKFSISVKDFGAVGDGKHDDIEALEHARDYVIQHPAVLIMPIGSYFISRPFILQNMVNGQNQFFTVHLKGIFPSKSASLEYLSRIICGYKSGFGIGIQLGRGIIIENITLLGMYTFPDQVTNLNIGTLKFSDWANGSVTDSRYNPYAGISIDPHGGISGGGGTSDVTIRNCSIRQWMVGICLTPNIETANDEIVNIIDDDIENCRVSIAVGQDQSKTIKISGLKVWGSSHTILDGLTYGKGTGGGSVFCDNWNIAGNVNQLFNLITDRFPLSAINIYSESIFRIGNVGRGAGSNFINFEIDFLAGPGMPAPDYLLSGDANFYGGSLRYYDGSLTHRMNFVNTRATFRDMTLNNLPITAGIYGIPHAVYPRPTVENVNLYYQTGYRDTLIRIPISKIIVNRTKWTAFFTCNGCKVGDYILGANRGCYDEGLYNTGCPTIQIGRVTRISSDSVFLDDVGLNCYSGMAYDAVYINRIR